jgi:hypothetical protein
LLLPIVESDVRWAATCAMLSKFGCSLAGYMRAVVVREPGSAENLQPAELPRPTAGAWSFGSGRPV